MGNRKNDERLGNVVAGLHQTRDPFRICRYENVHVVRHSLTGLRGMYIKIRGYDFIFLAQGLPPNVERFVCAHELGHYFLHGGMNRLFMDRRTYMETGRYETEADRFAAQLLFPRGMPLSDDAIDAAEMAEMLNIPKNNVSCRLAELGVCCADVFQ